MSRRRHYQNSSDYSDYMKSSRIKKTRGQSSKKQKTRGNTDDSLYLDDSLYQEDYYENKFNT